MCCNALVYVEWESRVNFVTIFGDLYINKLWGICTNLKQFTHLSSASGPNDDGIKMATKVYKASRDGTSGIFVISPSKLFQ